jgi:hypothetical protein
MLAPRTVLSSLSMLALLAAAVTSGACTAAGAPVNESDEDDSSLDSAVADGHRRAVTEQLWFKAGNGFRRTVPWSGNPAYADKGGFIWAQATAFEPLPESWWSTGLPSRNVTGFEAFTVGPKLHEQIWVVNYANGWRTERYDRTRDVHSGATTPWTYVMNDQGIPCSTADCRVTAWTLVLQGNKLLEGAWRGRTAHLRTNDVTVDPVTGNYSVTHFGQWGALPADKLPYPAGQYNASNIVGQQGFALRLDSPIGSDCLGRPVHGSYVQAWSHADGRGYARFVPVGADHSVRWDCAGPTGLVTYDAKDLPIGDASLHFLYEQNGSDPCVGQGDGAWCGGSIGGDQNTLYTCKSGWTAAKQECSAGCQGMPPGQPDMCKPAGGGQCCLLTPPGTLTDSYSACGGGGDHYGTDYGAPVGTPIPAGISGTVLAVATGYPNCVKNDDCSADCYNKFNYVKIKSDCGDPDQPGNDLVLWYMHIESLAPGVEAGAHVEQGQIIAYSGDSGCSFGPHIHLETASVPAGQSASAHTCNSQNPASNYCK